MVGIDPAPALIAKARELAADIPNASLQQADGSQLPIDAEMFDAAATRRPSCVVRRR
jgi:ubiquinone/menaquinone biosynthesis C-methylase UbiE